MEPTRALLGRVDRGAAQGLGRGLLEEQHDDTPEHRQLDSTELGRIN